MSDNPGEHTAPAGPSRSEQDGSKQGGSEQGGVRDLIAGSKDAITILSGEVAQNLKKPTTGAAIAGAAIVGSAFVFGAAETAVGVASAYVMYRILKRRKGSQPEHRRQQAEPTKT